ncbi:MAG: hypothetical protein LBI64_06890 [Coriobacteriales bacterium]|jgi:hypothetical protein|nr:hypothetical protein [Coriobacteriales bacterium]
MNAEELHNVVLKSFRQGDYKGGPYAAHALEQAHANAKEIANRKPNAFDTETCRVASLAAIVQKDWIQRDIWRARWLSRAVAIGWSESIGFWLVGLALNLLTMADRTKYSIDALTSVTEAEDILSEIDVLLSNTEPSGFELDDRFSPTRTGLARQLWEKRGLCALATNNYERAGVAFQNALDQDSSTRTRIKVGLYSALSVYLETLHTDGDVNPAIEMTDALKSEAAYYEMADLVALGDENIGLMRQRSLSVFPYDIL